THYLYNTHSYNVSYHTYSLCHSFLHLIFFFFSSRRRHTRWPRDWSSDVCSSDLEFCICRRNTKTATSKIPISVTVTRYERNWPRSEERRVGKEGRWGWWREDEKEKRKE